MNIRILYPIIAVALPLAGIAIAIAASLVQPCCNVIGVDAVRGVVEVRNRFTGRLMQINSPELARTLKVGDELDANPTMSQITSIKGVARTLPLIEPDALQPCCNVVSIAKDKQIANGLLSGIMTGAGKPYDAVAPFHGVVIAKDLTTGVLHVLDTGVQTMQGTSSGATAGKATMSKVIDELKVDDPVWVSGKHGMVKGKGGIYAFKLRGAEGKDNQPWVVEPDPKAEGRYGIVRTNWHEKTSNGFWNLYVFLPGKRDKDEAHAFHKKELSVMEGEYDLRINGMFLEKVPIKAGHATRILLGALRSTAKFSTQLVIYDSKDSRINAIQGGTIIALPVGTYHIKVGTRTIKVEIKEDEVTDF